MPNNWKTYKLEEVLDALIDYRGKTPKKKNFGIPLITAKIVKQGKILEPTEFISVEDYNGWMTRGMPEIGDVVLTTEAPLGEVAQLKDSNIALAQRIVTLRGKKDFLDNSYLKYFLQSKEGQKRLVARESGTTVSGIKQSELRKVLIDFPSYIEQKSIASILSAIDDKIENNLAINKTLEEMAMALYKHWFVDFGPFQDGEFVESELGRIPKGWEVLSLDDVSTLTAGGDKPKNFSNTKTDECNIPIYSNGITNDGLYGFTDTARINEESITVSARGTIGFVCLRLEPYLPIVRLIAVVPKQDFVTSKYLFYWLKTQNINGNGTTQQQLTVPDFRVTKVMVPKSEFVNKFTDIINRYYDAINSNISENQTLTQLRDTLLPKLISGEVRLKEFREESITN